MLPLAPAPSAPSAHVALALAALELAAAALDAALPAAAAARSGTAFAAGLESHSSGGNPVSTRMLLSSVHTFAVQS